MNLKQLKHQQGAALYVVLITILLAMLVSIWAARSALFGEMVIGNNADYQRAFEAAEALIQDAELDISRSLAGTCKPSTSMASVCRTGTTVKFPIEDKLVTPIINSLDGSGTTGCLNGVCTKRVLAQDWWNNATILASMLPVGARYGQYTGARADGGAAGAVSNPILADRTNGNGGWYWIEILPYDQTGENSALITGVTTTSPTGGSSTTVNAGTSILTVNSEAPVIYRITAVARGLRNNTEAVIQNTLILNKKMS